MSDETMRWHCSADDVTLVLRFSGQRGVERARDWAEQMTALADQLESNIRGEPEAEHFSALSLWCERHKEHP